MKISIMKLAFSLFVILSLSACSSSKKTAPAVPSIGVPTVEQKVVIHPQTKKEVTVENTIPYAVKTLEEGVALSPYYPHGLLDVSGLPADMVVKDPLTGLLVRVPSWR